MDRYQRVEKPRSETVVQENELRITAQGRVRNYITYGLMLLQEREANEIVLKAMGRAINKTVMIAELIKRRVVGLHQMTSIESADLIDTWEPLEEGLLPLQTTRHVSVIIITLSKKELDASSPGYQSPLPADLVKPSAEFEYEELSPGTNRRGRGGRGRGRYRGNNDAVPNYGEEERFDAGFAHRGRGRGRGRGRNFNMRGRGYNSGYDERNMYQESGGFDEVGRQEPPQWRGNGRGIRRGRGRAQNYSLDGQAPVDL